MPGFDLSEITLSNSYIPTRQTQVSLGGYSANYADLESSGGSPSSSGNKGKGGAVASGVISGVTEIATSLINAQRTKNRYEFNARMAEIQGRMRRLTADVAIEGIRKKSNAIYGAQRARIAKAGIKFVGSPVEVARSSLEAAELDIIYTNISADFDVGQFQVQSDLLKGQADMAFLGAVQKTNKTLLNVNTLYQINKAKNEE